MKRHRTLLVVAGLALLPLGCQGTQGRQERTPEERSTPPAGTQQGNDEAPTASELAQDVKGAVDQAKQVADVKLALMADPNVDGSKIDVDGDEATKTIHLKGTVATPAQKTAAERIARAKAEGWKVHNMLTVK